MPVLPPIPFAPGRVYDPTRSENTIMQLMLHQGDVAANRAYNTANIWGNTVANLGQIAGKYVAQKQDQQEQQKRQAGIDSVLQGWDGQDPKQLIHGLSQYMNLPDSMKAAAGVMSLQAAAQKNQTGGLPSDQDFQSFAVGAHAIMKNAGPDYLAQHYPLLRQQWGGYVKAKYGVDLPEQFTPEVGQQLGALVDTFGATKGEDETAVVGGALVKKKTGDVIYQAPDKPEKIPAVGTFERAVIDKFGPNATPEQVMSLRRGWTEAGREPKAEPEMTDFRGLIRQSPTGKPYVTAADVNTGKEASELSKWARANGVQYLQKDRADVLSEVQNARSDLASAYESVKDLFGEDLRGVAENNISAKLQFTDAGKRLAAYQKTIQEAATRVSRATSGKGGIRFSKELLAASRQAMPNPLSDVKGTAEIGYQRVMKNLQNVEDSILGGQGSESGAKVETKPVPASTVGRFTVEVEQ